MRAHKAQTSPMNGLFRAMASAASRQIAAHSTQQRGQSLSLGLPTMCAKQFPQESAQALQAARQSRTD
jgi:hypothetical protein